ncbi:hypothetical protein [Clostridium sardiniense]|uniref:hypothetical protein n=1 Tax=Clostridium sardiniense TaxID=29369 RepID=UPI001958A760|nr:hypothetical protein [Clostridium sardiniense]MBM7835629.1 hypothetical protein [Clostridium sardiniense]
MDLTFLDKIEIEEEQKGKEETVKSIRFSKDEYYMLKYCKFLNKKFSTFIKELINESIVELKNERIIEKDLDGIKEQLKNEIKQELLKELSVNNEDEIAIEKEIDNKKLEAQKDIFNFMNNKK